MVDTISNHYRCPGKRHRHLLFHHHCDEIMESAPLCMLSDVE